MELSIVVPVYNVQDYLKECLDSLVRLNIDDYEIIVVNDGSTDNSQSIVDAFVTAYPGLVRCHVQKNGGLSVARNTGISLAQGRYVVFIDSDDYILAEAFENFWKDTKALQLDIGIANLERDYDGEIVADNVSGQKRTRLERLGTMDGQSYIAASYDYLKDEIKVEAVTKIYRKEFLLHNALLFQPRLIYEDTLFFVQAMLAAERVKYFPYVFYRYRMRQGSIMHTVKRKNFESQWYIACQMAQMREKAPRATCAMDSLTVSLIYMASKCEDVIDSRKAKEILKKVTHITPKSGIKKMLMQLTIR